MSKSRYRKPIGYGSHSTAMARVADINNAIKREEQRHTLKEANLLRQMQAAQGMNQDARQRVALVRIAGEREEESLRHKQKMEVLKQRRRKALD